jgi:hypothetical protein
MSIVGRGLTGDRGRHSEAVCNDDVIGKDSRTLVGTPLESTASIANRYGIGNVQGTVFAGVSVPKIESVLGVIAEVGMIDVGRETGLRGGPDAIAIPTAALTVTGDSVVTRICLIAAAPFDSGVFEIPYAMKVRGSVSVVEIPSGCAVVSDITAHTCDYASNGAFDAAPGVSVNPHIL